MKGVVLAGGSGTRLRPLTHTGPKQLIPIANKPNIHYCLEDLRDAGIKDIAVILGNNLPEKVREMLGDGSPLGVKITYIVQGDPRGIAHAVDCAKDFTGDDPFVVYLGDNILKGGIKEMVDDFLGGKSEASVALTPVPNPQQFGVAELRDDGSIIRLVEKPKEPKSNLALVGIYMFRKSIFDSIAKLKPSWRNELEITEAIDNLVQEKRSVGTHIVRGWWKDTGKPEDILEANHLVLDELQREILGSVEDGANAKGKIKIGKGTVVKSGATIRGPAIIGENCTIGEGTYIGPYSAIGDSCVIEGAEIDSSIVLPGCTITCHEKIVESLIGSNTVINSAKGDRPAGRRLIIGENSTLRI